MPQTAMSGHSPQQDDLLETYKWATCKKCPMGLRCLQGEPVRHAFWCQACVGWWLPDMSVVVKCDAFVNTKPLLDAFEKAFPRHTRSQSLLGVRHMNWIAQVYFSTYGNLARTYNLTMLEHCPRCKPKSADETRNPPQLVVGVLYEDA